MLFPAFMLLALTAGAQEQPAGGQPDQSAQPQSVAPSAMSAGIGEPHKTKILTLEEAIRLALQHNLDIQISRYNPIIDQYNIGYDTGTYYDPAFKFTAVHSFISSPGGFNANSSLPAPANERNANFFQPELFGTLPTGLTYDLTGPLTEQTGNAIPGTSRYSSDLGPGITLKQPILKNFWIDVSRAAILLDKNTVESDVLGLRLKIMTVITNLKIAYHNLIGARETVRVNVEALELAEQLVAENVKRVQVGALAPLDEKQSESQAATSRANLLAAEQALSSQENIFKNLLTDNFGEWADITPIPAEQLVAVPEAINLQESWRLGITQRPELLQAKLFVERQNITIKYTYNQLFPEVDLTGSYGRNAVNSTFDSFLNDIGNGMNPYYSYGVTVTIPLGNRAARSKYGSAKASLKQALLQLKQEEQFIVVSIDNEVKIVRPDLQQVDATRAARIYAEAALEAEQKKLENGKSTSFVVLQLQSNLTTARSAEIIALANYNNALELLALDEGDTLGRNHIELKTK